MYSTRGICFSQRPYRLHAQCIQWNPSNPDATGAQESVLIRTVVLISGVEKYTNVVLDKEESREVSLSQG